MRVAELQPDVQALLSAIQIAVAEHKAPPRLILALSPLLPDIIAALARDKGKDELSAVLLDVVAGRTLGVVTARNEQPKPAGSQNHPLAQRRTLLPLARIAARIGHHAAAAEFVWASERARPGSPETLRMLLASAALADRLEGLGARLAGPAGWQPVWAEHLPDLDAKASLSLLRIATAAGNELLIGPVLARLEELGASLDAATLLRLEQDAPEAAARLGEILARVKREAAPMSGTPSGELAEVATPAPPPAPPPATPRATPAAPAGPVDADVPKPKPEPPPPESGRPARSPPVASEPTPEALTSEPSADALLQELMAMRERRKGLARAAYAAGEFRTVLQLLDSAVERCTADPAEVRLAILAAGKLHDYARGDALLGRAAVLAKAGDWEALLDLSSMAWEAGRFAASADFLKRARALAPEEPMIWLRIGEFLLRRGDLAAAGGALARAGAAGATQLKRVRRIAEGTGIALPSGVAEGDLLAAMERPAPPWTGALVRQILAVSERRQPSLMPRTIAVVGMHLGYGGSPQKARRFAAALAEALAPDDVRIVYLCPVPQEEGSSARAALARAGVETVVYGDNSAPSASSAPQAAEVASALALLEPSRRRQRIQALAHALAVRGVDVVHVMGTNELMLEAALGAALGGVPRILLNPGMMRPDRYAKKDQGLDEARLYRELFRAVAADPRFSIVNNSLVAAADYTDWIGLAPSEVGLLYNGIEAIPALDREEARARLGLAGSDRVVVVVGRIAAEKRPDLVLDVAERLLVDQPALRLIFVGTGPMEEWLSAEVAQRALGHHVRLAGYQSDVAPFYAAADACLLVSEAEGLPNVVLEAQGHGLPVVATDAGGAREAMVPGVTGLIVQEMAAEPLARAVATVLDPAFAARAAAAAQARIASRFAMATMVRSALPYYGTSDAAAHLGADAALRIARTADLPFDLRSAVKRAEKLIASELPAAADRLARAVLRRAPDDARAWGVRGRAQRRLGRWDTRRGRFLRFLAARVAGGHLKPEAHLAILAALREHAELLSALPPDEHDSPRAEGAARHAGKWSRVPGEPPAPDGLTPFAGRSLALLGEAPAPRQRPPGAAGELIVWIGDLGLGGGERQVLNLCRGLVATTPRRVTLLVGALRGEEAYEAKAEGRLRIADAGSFARDVPPNDILADYREHFASAQPDIVHVRGVAENAVTVALAATLAGVPGVVMNIGTMLPARQSDGSLSQTLTNAGNLAVLSALAKRPNVVFAFNSEAARQDWCQAMALDPARARVVRNGFDPASLGGAPPAETEHALAALDAARARGEPVVGGVFRLHHVKDPTLWVEVAARILKAKPRARFVLVGEGRLRRHAAALAGALGFRDRLHFLGAVNSGLGAVYARMDALLVTSRVESSPNVIIESLAAGRAVVAPNVGGIGEAIPSSSGALLVPRRTVDDLAAAALRVLDDLEGRAQVAQEGPRLVEKRFNMADFVEGFEAIYAAFER